MTRLVLACALALTGPAAAQRSHVVIVTGLSGEPRFATIFRQVGAALYDAAGTWGVADSSRIYLAEDRAADTTRIRGRATRDTLAAELLALSRRIKAGDVVLLFLLGHGSGHGPNSRPTLP